MRKVILPLAVLIPVLLSGATFKHLKTDTDGFPKLTHTSVLALDEQGIPLKGLKEKDFTISLDGVVDSTRIEIKSLTTFEKSDQNLSIILCVDVSGSMKGTPLQNIKAALLEYVEKKKAGDEIALLSFSESPVVEQAFTKDKNALKISIEALRARGRSTALYYGINQALEELKTKAGNQGRFMILFSDGWNDTNLPESESYTQQDIIAGALESQVPIFTVGYAAKSKEYLQALDRIAKGTNGSYFESPTAQDIQRNVDLAAQQIRGSYILSYAVYDTPGDGKEHQLAVTLLKDGAGKLDFTRKITVPPNREAISREQPAEKKSIPLWVILTIIGSVLTAAAALIAVLVTKSRKRKRLLMLREEEEARGFLGRGSTFGDASGLSAETSIGSGLNTAEPSASGAGADKIPEAPYSRERTVILTPGTGTKVMPMHGNLKMEIIIGAQQGSSFTIGSEGATIGRAATNTIVLADSMVSSKHASVYTVNGLFMIEDLGSLNGIYINGQRVTRSQIESGATFKIGSNEGTFTLL